MASKGFYGVLKRLPKGYGWSEERRSFLMGMETDFAVHVLLMGIKGRKNAFFIGKKGGETVFAG